MRTCLMFFQVNLCCCKIFRFFWKLRLFLSVSKLGLCSVKYGFMFGSCLTNADA